MKRLLILSLLLGTLACTTSPQTRKSASEKPDRIIFLIGDGMGLSAVSTGIYFGEGPSNFERFKNIGLIKTYSATHKVTDSGASGTAMATGAKTYNGAIGVDTLQQKVTNITEVVSEYGWKTGVVSTSSITHATPASFYAHVEQRGMEEAIALQLLDSNIDFFAGGGIGYFNRREDGQDLFASAAAKGFFLDTLSLKKAASLEPGQKYGYLLAPGGMLPFTEGRGDFFPEATSLAIAQLSAKNDHFFLMVEGSQIDWAGHANNTEYLIGEMLDFEKVIRVALDFAEKDGHTLVVVTADHETGGFTLSGGFNKETGQSDDNVVEPSFATTGHSATLIPVFAYGPGAREFTGIYENTELFTKMAALAKE
jgi:alkaline phosphatase